MKPKIIRAKCNNCGECIEVCPVSYFKKLKGKVIVKQIPEEQCYGCGACEIRCPEEAIKLEEDE